MNGPDHYREAERLLESAALDFDHPKRSARQEAKHNVAAARVHATLALTAATAATRAFGPQETWGGHTIDVGPEWQEVTS